MTFNAKWGIQSPLSSQSREPASGSESSSRFHDGYVNERPASQQHDPDAKALLNRHLAAIQNNRRKHGNSALHELESKLAELCEKDSADSTGQEPLAIPEDELPGEYKSPNLTDRLRELTNYLDADLNRIEQDKTEFVTAAETETDYEPERWQQPESQETRTPHKSINTPILDRAWFEDRFEAMRSTIDEIAQQIPDKRVEALGDQFHQLMEKLDLIEANRSREAVESGLKKLATYLEENRHWTISHDNRIKEMEERLEHLGRLVAQSNAALSATAKGLEIVARGTGPELASKTADLVAKQLEQRFTQIDSSEKVAQLTSEVGKLANQSENFVRKTENRLKLLQTSLDANLSRLEDIGQPTAKFAEESGWDDEIDADTFRQPDSGKLAAARRAAHLTSEPQQDLPEEGEPVRHQIPYGEFLPPEERHNSHTGLIIAAIILLLASAAMLYLNLKDSGAAKLLSNTQNTQYHLNPGKTDANPPVRIMLANADSVTPRISTTATLTQKQTTPEPDFIPAVIATTQDETVNASQAAILGDSEAQFSIAESYLKQQNNESRAAANERLSKAARWFRRAAENGHISAQYRLATLYELGHGVRQNYAEAMKWYERAAVGGHVKAMHNLGVLSVKGAAVQPDYARAVYWFTKAAEHGQRDSQYNLAVLYEHGFGLTKDLRNALRWYAAAALQGDKKATEKRDYLSRLIPSAKSNITIAEVHSSNRAPKTTNFTIKTDDKPEPSESGRISKAVLNETFRNTSGNSGWGAKVTRLDHNVAKAQQLLTRLGYQPGYADGILGPKTAAAVRAFQQKLGIPQTGVITNALIARMKAEITL